MFGQAAFGRRGREQRQIVGELFFLQNYLGNFVQVTWSLAIIGFILATAIGASLALSRGAPPPASPAPR